MMWKTVDSRIHYEMLLYALFKNWFGNLLEIRLKLTHLRQNLYGSKFSPEGTVISQILSILEYSQLPKQMPDLIYGIRYLRFLNLMICLLSVKVCQ